MRMRDKLSISEIAKSTRLSRNTIKKWLKEPGDVAPTFTRWLDAVKNTDVLLLDDWGMTAMDAQTRAAGESIRKNGVGAKSKAASPLGDAGVAA
ncbi:MAG: hypothetical protein ABIN37_09315 [Burkholderiaceae bacterium]